MARYDRDYTLDQTRPPVTQRPVQDLRPHCYQDQERSVTHGRAGTSHTDDSQAPEPREVERPLRTLYPDRDRTYALRDSELKTLAEIGTFRALTQDDLAHYCYAGRTDQARRELNSLARQGLIRRRTTYPEHTVYVTLTRAGHRFINGHRPKETNPRQAFYHGFVKPREARHDAALYRLYQQEAERARRRGGKVTRVVLDFELKKSINRKLAKLRELPETEQGKQRQLIAHEHDLTVVDGKIPLPDLRLEYETPDHDQARVDLELATADYHRRSLAAKARAGFHMFAPRLEAARLRPAMPDSGLIQEILSL